MINNISIIIPIYNEIDNIILLIKEIKEKLSNSITYEIIIVNDGSTDETKYKLSQISKKNSNILVINHKKNYGQSIGIRTGIINSKFDIIVTLDGDGQNDPDNILKLVKRFNQKKSFTMVIGNRVTRNDSFSRKLASRLAFKIRKTILKDDTPDTGCAIKVFNKQDFLQLPFFNHIHRFLPYLFKVHKGNVISIPVNHRPRIRGVSKYSNFQRLLVGINDILGVIWIKKRTSWPVLYDKNKNLNTLRRSKNGN